MDNVPHHIETSQLICSANELTGFYMMGTLVTNGLSYFMPMFTFYTPWKQKTSGFLMFSGGCRKGALAMFYSDNIFFKNCLQLEKIKNAELEGKEVHRVTPETITETDHVFSEAGELLSHIPIHSGRKFLINSKATVQRWPTKAHKQPF